MMKKGLSMLLGALTIAAAAMALAPGGAPSPLPKAATDTPADNAEQRWVDSVYSALTPRQRVAQLFVPHLTVKDTPAGRRLINKYVAEDGVGGLLLGSGDIAAYAALNGYAQSLADVPLMITADAEWGLSMRLSDAPRFPHNIALGASADTAALAAYGREMARECRRLGITGSFAPVADVNSNAANPVIGYRSFGEDPAKVAALSAAYARGLEEGGVMSVGKHFPGHGDTSTDSHKTLPVVNRSVKELEKVELVPFDVLIKSGMNGIMVGHIKVPSLDPSGTPASLSERVITGLLREKMGFDGLIFTDALEMAGAQVKGANNCVLALKAGADVLLGSLKPSTDIDAVIDAVDRGGLDPRKVEQSIRRVLAYKYRLGLTRPQTVKAAGAKADINNAEAAAVKQILARAAITVVRNDDDMLPLRAGDKVSVTSVGAAESNPFTACVKHLCSEGECELTPSTAADVVFAPVMSSNAEAVARLTSLKASAGAKLVPVFFLNPYKVSAFAAVVKDLPAFVIAGDNTPELCEAAAEAIFGQEDARGRVPVNIKGVASPGDGMSLTAQRTGHSLPATVGVSPALTLTIDSLINCGLATKAFTGCQVMVVKEGQIIYDKSAGTVNGPGSANVTRETLFDLASVSKVAGTLTGLMAAYEKGLFKLDDRLEKHFPELADDPKGKITVRQLMLHESGLPAAINVTAAVIDTASVAGQRILTSRRDAVHTIPVETMWGHKDAQLRGDLYLWADAETGEFELPVAQGLYASPEAYDYLMGKVMDTKRNASSAYRYSDLNFLLLMELEQRLTGRNHEEWVDEAIYAPLGIDRMTYRPLELFDTDEIAATEQDRFLRRQKVQGYVHDETAAFMGGVAGNAGLFANAASLVTLCEMLHGRGTYGGKRILKEKTVDTFLTPRSTSGKRGLGFDTAGGGRYIGHTGFTGTCFWMDPTRGVTVVVLTNRVNPTRDNKAWNRLNFRSRILDAVESAMSR